MIYSNTDLAYLINSKKIIKKKIKSFDNTKISYIFNKSKNKRSYLIFIHGLTGSYNSWEEIIPYFVKKDYGIIALDIRGHFTSNKDINNYSYEACAKDINEIMKKEKIKKAVIITHCYGSIVGLELYRLFNEKIKALIFCSGDYAFALKNMYNINLNKFKKQILWMLKKTSNIFKKQVKYNPNKISKVTKKCYEFKNHWKTITKMFPYAVDYNGKKILSKINIPTLIITGNFDWLISKKNSIKMNKLIKNSEIYIVNFGEHFIITLKNNQTTKIINNFLNRHKF